MKEKIMSISERIKQIDIGKDYLDDNLDYNTKKIRERTISFLREQKKSLGEKAFDNLEREIKRILERKDIKKIHLSTEFKIAREKVLVQDNGAAEVKQLEYKVQKGDSLSKISKKFSVGVNEIVMLNNIDNPDILQIGQILTIFKAKSQKPKSLMFKNYEDIKSRQETWNDLGNEKLIHEYHKSNYSEEKYVIENKKEHILTVYDKGLPLFSCKTNSGASGDDYLTKTYTKKRGELVGGAGNMSTPAGIFKISGTGKYKNYPSFTRANENGDIPSSIHSYPKLNSQTPNISNGCTRILGKDLKELKKHLTVGTKVFILPEKPGSKFIIKNGNINFVADIPYSEHEDKSKKGWKDYSTYHPMEYSEIKIGSTDLRVNRTANFRSFADALSDNKKELQEDLGINNDSYNELSKLTLCIGEQESRFGTSTRYFLKTKLGDKFQDYFQKARKLSKDEHHSTSTVSVVYSAMKFWRIKYIPDTEANSKGIGQIKIDPLLKNVKISSLFEKYGINRENLLKGDKSALAIIIILASMYTDELPQIKEEMKKLGLSDMDAVIYLNHGKRKEIKNLTATPDKNKYLQTIKVNMSKFYIKQKDF